MRSKSWRAGLGLLCLALLLSTISGIYLLESAEAASSRAAVIKQLKGKVTARKAGGTKTFSAFKNMSLSEGDTLITGKGAKVVLQLPSSKAKQDTVTIAENSEVSFTKLKSGGSTKTRLSIWAGSLWVKVKSVTGADDQFEIKTPAAVMGVRGTHFAVSLDPWTNMVTTSSFSGTVAVTTPAVGDNLIYPSQMIAILPSPDERNVDYRIGIIDPASLVKNADPAVIEALLRNGADIQEENDRLLSRDQEELKSILQITGTGDLITYRNNLEAILNNTLLEAHRQNILSDDGIKLIAAEANQLADRPVYDLNKELPIVISAEQKRALEALQQLQQEALERRLEKQERAAAGQLPFNGDYLLLEERAQALRLANEQALIEAELRSFQDYAGLLSEQERQRLEQRRDALGLEQPPMVKQPVRQPTITAPAAGPVVQPAASLAFKNPILQKGLHNPKLMTPIDLNVLLGGFTGSDAVYGYEVRISYPSSYVSFNTASFADRSKTFRTSGPFKVEPEAGWPLAYTPEAVDQVFTARQPGDTEELVYSAVKYTGDPVEFADAAAVVTIPFYLNNLSGIPEELSFQLAVTAVNRSGQVIETAAAEPLVLKIAADAR
ncbi:FecR family protein [Paenibacillus tarimensis]|uniref:FecR family protein n=1 Tax=Paenibacillus tarimensis TaxID=416012 RepID=UPI001F1EE145|nr:FecR family protein [Paenibacillus tarimensis]MCF2943243.1 FecR domain-containing protein [Paenibacillus tarimensis]